MNLRPVTYNFNVDKENTILGINNDNSPKKYEIEKIKFSGFIAQEVEQAAIKSGYDFSGIHKPKHDKDLYGLTYSEFVVPLTKATQEQQQLIEKLQEDNKSLKAENDALKQQMLSFEQRLKQLEKQNGK